MKNIKNIIKDIRKKDRNRKKMWLAILLFTFALSLYLVEWSPVGSEALKQYNGGYGTFDMKSYDAEIVAEVLTMMQPKGFLVYTVYFICDYFFILCFGLLQIVLAHRVWKRTVSLKVVKVLMLVPILRGICDIVENTLLLYVIHHSMEDCDILVSLASYATKAKLLLIGLWLVLLLTGAGIRVYKNVKNKNAKLGRDERK